MGLFDIVILGDPRLRITSTNIKDITSSENQCVFDHLLNFVIEKQGMGIAAPQVGIPQRFFIMSSHPNSRYPDAPTMEPTVIINPEITWRSETRVKDWEGCLSVPGIRALVPRHEAIRVRYHQRTGEHVDTELTGFIARIFQHEYDHLDGLVFLDRVESTKDIVHESEWRKLTLCNQSQ
jgi:peptide deformylase